MSAEVYDEQDMTESNMYAMDHRLYVQFYQRAVQNHFRTAEEGRPIFDEKVFVKIIIPGDKNSVVDVAATDEYKARFAKQFERFKLNKQQAQDGTPLESVTWLSVGQVAELKALNIHTVDSLAVVPDQLAQRFMGAHELRRKAQAFIEAAAGEAATSKLASELAQRDSKIEALEAQLQQLVAAQQLAAAKGK
jgi:hypothetical protein